MKLEGWIWAPQLDKSARADDFVVSDFFSFDGWCLEF